MNAIARTKLFTHGGSQAVRIPKDLRLPEGEVTIRRHGQGVLIEPAAIDLEEWFRRLDEAFGPDFMAEGRQQPPMPSMRAVFGDDPSGH